MSILRYGFQGGALVCFTFFVPQPPAVVIANNRCLSVFALGFNAGVDRIGRTINTHMPVTVIANPDKRVYGFLPLSKKCVSDLDIATCFVCIRLSITGTGTGLCRRGRSRAPALCCRTCRLGSSFRAPCCGKRILCAAICCFADYFIDFSLYGLIYVVQNLIDGIYRSFCLLRVDHSLCRGVEPGGNDLIVFTNDKCGCIGCLRLIGMRYDSVKCAEYAHYKSVVATAVCRSPYFIMPNTGFQGRKCQFKYIIA